MTFICQCGATIEAHEITGTLKVKCERTGCAELKIVKSTEDKKLRRIRSWRDVAGFMEGGELH